MQCTPMYNPSICYCPEAVQWKPDVSSRWCFCLMHKLYTARRSGVEWLRCTFAIIDTREYHSMCVIRGRFVCVCLYISCVLLNACFHTRRVYRVHMCGVSHIQLEANARRTSGRDSVSHFISFARSVCECRFLCACW